jgi:two-component system sensor histidine kinase PilS (NtrC family)
VFDRGHFDQVLWNLVRNACHHGRRQPGSVLLHYRETDSAGALVLDIVDDGPGVSAEAVPHLFEPFFTTASTGTGLGLYIARELADVNGARLEFVPDRNEVRTGACFRITFTGAQNRA